MTRPKRIEYPGALYHITSRGHRREMIYCDDIDRGWWLYLLGEACHIFRFTVYAYCQMGNHFHLLLRTNEGKLARGMRYLNGEYSRHFNARHVHVGHLFQGRYTAIVCEDERYRRELARYIVLNPVRAQLVPAPGDWLWSSHAAAMGQVDPPRWLDVQALLMTFSDDPAVARKYYNAYVMEGIGKASPLSHVRHQIVLGDPDAIRELIPLPERVIDESIARAQRKLLVKPLSAYFTDQADRTVGMAAAFASLAYTTGEIARYCRVSTRTVSRAIKKHKIDKPL